jgi:hypothetical protein
VRGVVVVLAIWVSVASPASAQIGSEAPSVTRPAAPDSIPPAASLGPPLRRWLELQSFTLHARYRYLGSNRKGASHDPQYKESLRARFSADVKHRYTVNLGFFSGRQFIGTFDNIGLGINDGDYHSHYVKQLFAAASPIDGLEFQYGGIYVARGENTEITTYDDDGYLTGERVTLRRPREIGVDEISVTRAHLGPSNVPNLFRRWNGLNHPNYTQVLVGKRLTKAVAVSFDYSTVSAAETLRAAVAIRLRPHLPLTSLRYEQYYRTTPSAAGGFAVTAEAPPVRRVRLSGGYTSIDEHYDANTSAAKLNSERMQRGRRFFATASVPVKGPVNAVVFFTRARPEPYEMTNRTRADVMVVYDLLSVLKRSGTF